jgi:hypothetical protein
VSIKLATDKPPRMKRGCLVGAKDSQPRHRRTSQVTSTSTLEVISIATPFVIPENKEI